MERKTGLSQDDHQIQLDKVELYYNTAQKYYERMWYSKPWDPDGGALGLRYGMWAGNVENRLQAIIKENEILANLAEIKSGELVLDAGCGVSGSGIWLAQNRRAKVVELNIVEKQLRIGQRLAKKNSVSDKLHFSDADYHFLPYASETFDVFWSLESIEHSDNLEAFVSEAYRTLKRGGRMVIAGTFKGDVKPTEAQKYQLEVGARCAGAFNDFRSAVEVGQLAKGAGFRKVEVLDTTNWVMVSAEQMKNMCKMGLPFAKLGNKMGVISQIMVDNTAWGVYQEDLFKKGVTAYNILTAVK